MTRKHRIRKQLCKGIDHLHAILDPDNPLDTETSKNRDSHQTHSSSQALPADNSIDGRLSNSTHPSNNGPYVANPQRHQAMVQMSLRVNRDEIILRTKARALLDLVSPVSLICPSFFERVLQSYGPPMDRYPDGPEPVMRQLCDSRVLATGWVDLKLYIEGRGLDKFIDAKLYILQHPITDRLVDIVLGDDVLGAHFKLARKRQRTRVARFFSRFIGAGTSKPATTELVPFGLPSFKPKPQKATSADLEKASRDQQAKAAEDEALYRSLTEPKKSQQTESPDTLQSESSDPSEAEEK
ncbi:hypothetical protein NA57DRAFT_55704 [Rhizodiscina lignyota]|uniref:Uncharacterized protein n=1 Tax=Rhizodiscina lignyota TaxID=1504668 RepID=A0A9P4M6I7_9PEZI|nr:hypothetical protein NA57DRAFT_55704 [Rhizodiscina lignyota]